MYACCAPSSVSIVRAGLTASEQFKKVDSALSPFSDLTLEPRRGREVAGHTALPPAPFSVKLTWLLELLGEAKLKHSPALVFLELSLESSEPVVQAFLQMPRS